MGKRKDSRYRPGVGYIKGTLDELSRGSKNFFKDFKNNCSSSKLKKSFNFFSKSHLKSCGSRSRSKIFSCVKIGIYIGLFLFLVFCGLRLSAVILVLLLILALEFL